jgi:hypothetical protein
VADIIKFPTIEKKPVLNMVDHIDVAFCIWAVNMYGVPNNAELLEGYGFIGPEDVSTLEVEFVLTCLKEALISPELTARGKSIIARLLVNSKLASFND